MGDTILSNDDIGLTLRWAVLESGTAGLADTLGGSVVIPDPPALFMPSEAAISGPVRLLRRERSEGATAGSSHRVVHDHVSPGDVVFIHTDRSFGAAFGSGLALQAALRRAQAVVTDGAWRDAGRLRALSLPVGSQGSDPTRPAGCPLVPSERETMFGRSWVNGDWFLRDADGAIGLSADEASELAAGLRANPTGDLRTLLAAGQPR